VHVRACVRAGMCLPSVVPGGASVQSLGVQYGRVMMFLNLTGLEFDLLCSPAI